MKVKDPGMLRRWRHHENLSQEQLAEYAGLNRSYVGEIERGSAIASIVTADKLARAFNVPIATLLCASPPVEPPPHERSASPPQLPA